MSRGDDEGYSYIGTDWKAVALIASIVQGQLDDADMNLIKMKRKASDLK